MLPDSLYREALRTSRGFAASARLKSRRQQSDTAEYNEFGEPISVGFLANRSGVHSIGSLPGLENSQPFAINSRGIIVGRAYNNAEDPSRPFDNRAFVWDHGVMRDIGTLGGAIAAACGVNDAGSTVGGSRTATDEPHAFLYENGLMHDLGTLGGSFSQGRSINKQGQIVGRSELADGQQHAFLYEHGVMRDLGTLGGTFSRAEFINNRGDIRRRFGDCRR